jgi:hypothetical protein
MALAPGTFVGGNVTIESTLPGGMLLSEFLGMKATALPGLMRKAISAAASLYVTELKKKLSTQGSGRIYARYNPRRIHQASAPDSEPPSPDQGTLRTSITKAWVTRSKSKTSVKIGTPFNYGRYLEYGTSWRMGSRRSNGLSWGMTGGGVAPRPWMRPVIDGKKGDVTIMLTELVNAWWRTAFGGLDGEGI